MAQSSTNVTGKDAVLQVDDEGGSLTDISGNTNAVALALTLATEPNRTLGCDWPFRTQAARDMTMDLTILYSTTADEGADVLITWWNNGGVRSVQLDIPDSNAGSVRYSGDFKIESCNQNPVAGEAAALQVTATIGIHGIGSIATIGS